MNDTKVIGIIIIITILIFGGGIFMLSKNTPVTTQGNTVSSKTELVKPNTLVRKAPQEKVTVVEFGDFQCPACASAEVLVETLLQKYPKTVTVAFRHFPLPQHKNAVISAYAAEAANAQGKFWEMVKLLYDNQTAWSESGDPTAQFVQYAKQLNLNVEEFTASIQNKTFSTKVEEDLQDGISLGVNSTPTFYVNGRKIETQNLLRVVEEDLL